MPQERAADAEGVPEVHGWHRSERIDVFPRLPDGLGVVVAHAVHETVFLREEARWHARVGDEGYEGEEVCEGHGAADYCEGGVRGRGEVVPSYEAVVLMLAFWNHGW